MPADDASVAITVEGALLKISSAADGVAVRPGISVLLPIRIARSAKLEGPVQLEVHAPHALESSVRSERMIVPPGQTDVMLPMEVDADLQFTGRETISVRALALQSGRLPALSESAQVGPLEPELVALLKTGVLPVLAETTITLEFAAEP
jgi:hypothetical protein